MAYATVAEFYSLALPEASLGGLASATIEAQLTGASAIADSYLGRRYAVPLGTWGSDLRVCVCALAAYRILLMSIGFNPNNPQDRAVEDDYKRWLQWLKDVADGNVKPAGITEDPSGQGPGSIFINYEPSRELTDGEWFGDE